MDRTLCWKSFVALYYALADPRGRLGCGPGPDPPSFPPRMWAWTGSHSISPLGVVLDRGMLGYLLQCMLGYTHPPETCCKACWDTSRNACWDTHTPLPVNRMTNRCKNMTLTATSLRPVIIVLLGVGAPPRENTGSASNINSSLYQLYYVNSEESSHIETS